MGKVLAVNTVNPTSEKSGRAPRYGRFMNLNVSRSRKILTRTVAKPVNDWLPSSRTSTLY